MLSISKVAVSDLDNLISLSKKTFLDTFIYSELNDPADVESHAVTAFTYDKMLAQLSNSNSAFYFAIWEDEPVGYIKVNYTGAQTELNDEISLELERIYVLADHQSKRIGKELLNFAIQLAKKDKLQYLWLGVWEHNQKAINFYERNGFETFGSHGFMLGNDKQTDLLMRRSIL